MEVLILMVVLAGAIFYFRKKKSRKEHPLPKWVCGFIIFYAADRTSMAAGLGGAYQEISRLIRQELNFSDHQSIMVLLRSYVSELKPETGSFQNDLSAIIMAMPNVLKFELAGYNTPGAIQNFLVSNNPELKERSTLEINEMAQKIHRAIKDKDPEAMQFEDMLVRFRLDRVFEKMHGRTRAEFSNQIMKSFEGQ